MSFQLQQQIEKLRTATARGDDETATRCEEQFGTALGRIVRRVVRSGRKCDGLSTTILQQVRQVRDFRPDLERDDLVAEVTTRLCALLGGKDIDNRVDTVAAGGGATVGDARPNQAGGHTAPGEAQAPLPSRARPRGPRRGGALARSGV